VVDLVAEHARSWFDEHPEAFDFSVGMDDIAYMCECDDCRALDASPEAYAERRFSDRHYWFTNRVARELAESHPDKRVGTLIYAIARELPEKIDRLEPNVFGYLTQCEAEWFRDGREEEDKALTRAWAERCDHLCRYTYWGLGWVTPRNFPHYMADAIKSDHELGFHGQYVEVYTCWPNTAPMIWASTQLFWDASLDIDDLLDEFMTKTYGPADDEMARYFAKLEETWTAGHPDRHTWGHRNVPTQAASLTVEQAAELQRLLNRARRAAGDDGLVSARIDIVQAGLDFGAALARAVAVSERLASLQVSDADEARDAIRLVMGQGSLVDERERLITDTLARNDLAGETFNALVNNYGRHAAPDFSILDSGGTTAVARALGWLAEHDPGGLDEVSVELASAAQAGPIARMLRACLHVLRESPTNLLANPSFEETGANEGAAELDWDTAGAPRGWSTWHRAPRRTQFGLRPRGAPERGVVAHVSAASSAAILQSVPVEDGWVYLCRLDARRQPADGAAHVGMTVRWQDAEGRWLDTSAGETRTRVPTGAEDWVPMYALAQPPEGAGRLVFMCSASAQGEDDMALFDDAGVFAVPVDVLAGGTED